MGRTFTLQHTVVGPLRCAGDAVVGCRYLRRDELFSRVANTRDWTKTRYWRSAATSVVADFETGICADDCRRCAWISGSIRADTFVIGPVVWSHRCGCNDVHDDLVAAGDCFLTRLLFAGAARYEDRSTPGFTLRIGPDLKIFRIYMRILKNLVHPV